MKKMLTLMIVLSVFVFFQGNFRAQGISLGIGGGLSTIQTPDALTNDISNGGAGFSTGWHLGAKAKFSIPLSPFTPIAFINYHKFDGSGSTILGEVSASMSVLSIGVGGESKLLPGPISPYFQISIAYNSIGDLEREGALPVGVSSSTPSRGRLGLGLGVGAEIVFVEGTITYNFLNLIGKEDGEETVGTLNLSVFLML